MQQSAQQGAEGVHGKKAIGGGVPDVLVNPIADAVELAEMRCNGWMAAHLHTHIGSAEGVRQVAALQQHCCGPK